MSDDAKAVEQAAVAIHHLVWEEDCPLNDIGQRKLIRDIARLATTAYKAALSEAGYVIVPTEPSPAERANEENHWDYGCHVCGGWMEARKAMIRDSLK